MTLELPPTEDQRNIDALVELGFNTTDPNFEDYLKIYEDLLGGTEPITQENILAAFTQFDGGSLGGNAEA